MDKVTKVFLCIFLAYQPMSVGFGRPPGLAARHFIKVCLETSGAHYNTSESDVCCSCYAGQHWKADCKPNAPNTTQCQPCIYNDTLQTYTSEANIYEVCNVSKSPSVCENFMYTRFEDGNATIDNKCVCVSGTYAKDPEESGCKNFTKCPPDFEAKKEGDSTHDVKCGPCAEGMCSYLFSDVEKCVPCGNDVTTVRKYDEIETTPVTAQVVDNSFKVATIVIATFLGLVLVLLVVVVYLLYKKNRLPCQKKSNKDSAGSRSYDVEYSEVKKETANSRHGSQESLRSKNNNMANGSNRQNGNGGAANGSGGHMKDGKRQRTFADTEEDPKQGYSDYDIDEHKPFLDGKSNPKSQQEGENPAATDVDHGTEVVTSESPDILNRDSPPANASEQDEREEHGAVVSVSPAAIVFNPEKAGIDKGHMTEESTQQTQLPDIPNEDIPCANTSDEQVKNSQLPASPGNEAESSDRNLQFEQDLELFEYGSDKEALKRINKPDAVHKALSSQDCLKWMCDRLPWKINTLYLSEFLITTRLNNKQLLDSVKMDEVDHDTKNEREKKRRYLAEMLQQQGEQLSPRILLEKARSFYIRKLYDELCQGFIEYFDQ